MKMIKVLLTIALLITNIQADMLEEPKITREDIEQAINEDKTVDEVITILEKFLKDKSW